MPDADKPYGEIEDLELFEKDFSVFLSIRPEKVGHSSVPDADKPYGEM